MYPTIISRSLFLSPMTATSKRFNKSKETKTPAVGTRLVANLRIYIRTGSETSVMSVMGNVTSLTYRIPGKDMRFVRKTIR